MKLALAQINPHVGNIERNTKKIIEYIQRAEQQHADLTIFPEMCLTGYPPKDLLLKKKFIEANINAFKNIFPYCKKTTAIIGFVDQRDGNLYNAAAIINNQKLLKVYHKIHLPNYDVFDEKRYFGAGSEPVIITINGTKIGVNICEDIWMDNGPTTIQCEQGAQLIINISASPFHAGKAYVREELLSRRAKENKCPILYLNLVGGQDDLIFDGRSYLFDTEGQIVLKAKSFEEDFIIYDCKNLDHTNQSNRVITPQPEEEITKDIHDALVLAIKDYFCKNNFKKAIIGLSGGIDSALTATLAVKALGPENVVGITMPSKFSSTGSVNDSYTLAKNLAIQIHTIPIKQVYDSYITTLNPQFRTTTFNVAEENIQARIRGNLLMAMSNKFGHLVLATGNKSELSVGYATLYGDMAGGLAVISDVFKTKVYDLCYYINKTAGREIIPRSIIEKEPSAELRENQKDSDSLPVYGVLDPILKAYIEEELSKEEIIAQGFDVATIDKVTRLVDQNEYKRQQAALGFRITPRAFGTGRRIPITNGWRG